LRRRSEAAPWEEAGAGRHDRRLRGPGLIRLPRLGREIVCLNQSQKKQVRAHGTTCRTAQGGGPSWRILWGRCTLRPGACLPPPFSGRGVGYSGKKTGPARALHRGGGRKGAPRRPAEKSSRFLLPAPRAGGAKYGGPWAGRLLFLGDPHRPGAGFTAAGSWSRPWEKAVLAGPGGFLFLPDFPFAFRGFFLFSRDCVGRGRTRGPPWKRKGPRLTARGPLLFRGLQRPPCSEGFWAGGRGALWGPRPASCSANSSRREFTARGARTPPPPPRLGIGSGMEGGVGTAPWGPGRRRGGAVA